MHQLEVMLQSGPHGLEQARTLHDTAARNGRGRGGGFMLWNVTLTLQIFAPDSWWRQARQYFPEVLWLRSRSESKPDEPDSARRLSQADFENPVPQRLLDHLNALASEGTRAALKAQLPESFLRSGVVHTNMETILTILRERGHYNAGHWHLFCAAVRGMDGLQTFMQDHGREG